MEEFAAKGGVGMELPEAKAAVAAAQRLLAAQAKVSPDSGENGLPMALEDKRLDDVTIYQLEILHVDSIMRLASFFLGCRGESHRG